MEHPMEHPGEVLSACFPALRSAGRGPPLWMPRGAVHRQPCGWFEGSTASSSATAAGTGRASPGPCVGKAKAERTEIATVAEFADRNDERGRKSG